MELPSKLFEQIAFTTGPKIEENMMVVLDKSIHEEHLSQTIQSNIKQFKIVNQFLSSYIGIFNVTHQKKTKFVPQNQFLIRMVSSKKLFHQVLTNSNL